MVGEETRHARILGEERLDEIGMKHRVELAFGQHRLDRFVVQQAGIFDVRRQADFDVILDLRDPLNAVERHAVFALQDTAHPEHRRCHHRLDADPAVFQVGRLLDALRRVDEHEAVAEAAM